MHPVTVIMLVTLGIALYVGGIIIGGVLGATGLVIGIVLFTHVGVKVTEPKRSNDDDQQAEAAI